MRNSSWIVGLVLLGFSAFFHLPDAPVEAGPQPAAGTVRGFHVRVALVRRSAEPRLAPPSWELAGGAGRTKLSWNQMRDELRKRGAVEVMLDQNGSAADGRVYKFNQSTRNPVMQPQRRDSNKETLQLNNVQTGVSGSLVVKEVLEYQYLVNWTHWRIGTRVVPQANSSWEGTAAPLAYGETLVVHNRVDILGEVPPSSSATGAPSVVEIYCFLTATPASPTAPAEAGPK